MSEVFISYKQDQRERMRPLAEGLRALGVDVWFDERLQPDRAFTEEIADVIQNCRAQIVCWSPAAVTSEWVRGEAEIGRQRGVLVAAMIEPCTLLPPFNMYHAENLVGWTGEAAHAGWRKIAEAVGRKLDRPGLGELAALQGSTDAAAWKKWAQKYPNDPQADVVWAKAEELEIGAARERMARDRDAARRAADEAAQRRAAPPAAPVSPPPTAPRRSEPQRRGAPLLWLAIAGAVVAAGVAGVLVLPRLVPAPAPTAERAATNQAPNVATPPPAQSPAQAPEQAPEQAANGAAPAADPAASALTAIGRIRAREWANRFTIDDLLPRVVAASSRASLEAAARTDPRAQTLVAIGYDDGTGGFTRNKTEAVRLFRLAADRGFAPAAFALGVMYEWGNPPAGVSSDKARAAELYRQAANSGYAPAQGFLGLMYARGDGGVARDDAEAVRLFRLASDQGDAEGELYLAGMYEGGRGGLSADHAEAVRLYKLAARQGEAHAQAILQGLGESW